MERASFSAFRCSIARTLDEVGEWWTFLVLRDLFVGMARFDEIQRDLGVSTNVLSARLKRLTELGVIERGVAPDDARSFVYMLTAKGRDLYPVLLALVAWGDKWQALPEGPPMLLTHRSCGQVTVAVPHCAVCGEALALDDLAFGAGPGGKAAPGTARMGHYLQHR